MSVSPAAVEAASRQLNMLARAYIAAGSTDRADEIVRFAADLELASPDLQQCWGGPMNGQEGRRALLLDAIRLCEPSAILETGTFRGISTVWFAENFPGPVISCEKERLYHLQARQRAEGIANIELHLDDSRSFLQRVLSSLPRERPVFIYLDAHWELDLPIREELKLIFANTDSACVAIDDFRVPDDPGYGWDDYGENGKLELSYIKDLLPEGCRVLFPRLRSSGETGAYRGCCLIVTGSARHVETSDLLRGANAADWLAIEAEAASIPPTVQSEVEHSTTQLSYPEQIVLLRQEIENLAERLAISEADREQRLAGIMTLTRGLHDANGRLQLLQQQLREHNLAAI